MRPWTERVDGQGTDGGGGRGELGADGSESILPREPIMVEKVLDGLAGGRHYGMEVWAVNEAGQGRGSGQLGVEMPVAGLDNDHFIFGTNSFEFSTTKTGKSHTNIRGYN